MKLAFVIATMLAMLGAGLATAEAVSPLPLVTSILLGSRAHDLVLEGRRPCASGLCDYAYVATNPGLSVVEITDPANPVERGAVNLGGKSLGLDRQGSLVFVANEATGLHVVDVSNPAAPVVVASRALPGAMGARDVAVKDDVAYVGMWAGEVFVIRHSRATPTGPVTLTPIKTIGLLAWGIKSGDAKPLAKMHKYPTRGNAKISGIAISGKTLVANDAAYGRLFFYDVSDADTPLFIGTHGAPYMFRGELDPARITAQGYAAVVYGFAAYSAKSGTYSLPLDHLPQPNAQTRYDRCAGCDYVAIPATDFGGLSVTGNGRYVLAVGGHQGVIQVIDVSDPSNMVVVASAPIVGHLSELFDTMNAQALGNHIFAAVGALGFRVYSSPGITD